MVIRMMRMLNKRKLTCTALGSMCPIVVRFRSGLQRIKCEEACRRQRKVPGVTEPFMFSRLFLVTGILLAAVAVAGLISG